jgi:predicted AAA+ superfamily ATPase
VDDYRLRNITDIILGTLTEIPVVLLHGARQTGKTTLAQHLAQIAYPARYLTLDDDAMLAAARTDPAAFLEGLQGPVVLDEVQRAPGLLPAIQAEVDRHRRPGRFLLIGSANVLPLPQLSESRAGRIEMTLHPFSQGEIQAVRENFIDALFYDTLSPAGVCYDLPARMLRGGYPSAPERTDPESRRAWFGSYLTTVLSDIRGLSRIDASASLPRLLALIAARIAGLLNFMDLARGSGIPQTTLKRYFALLEATFLARLVPAWANELDKRLIQAPKLYLNDTGLAAHLLDLDEGRLERDAGLQAALLENFVGMELDKQAGWSQSCPELFHFRTAAGQKVDFVLENPDGDIVGVEVKASAKVSNRDFNGLRALEELAGPHFRNGIVFHTGSDRNSFGPRLRAAPVSALWQSHAGGA